MAEIIGLRDKVLPDENGAHPGIVALLEEVLMMAKRGEIVALALARVHGNGQMFTSARGGHLHQLVAACTYLQHDLVRGTDG